MNEFSRTPYSYLQEDLRSLEQTMRYNSKYTMEQAVDVLLAMAKHYEKMGGDYKRREKLNKEFKND
jgi:hypothetical protein